MRKRSAPFLVILCILVVSCYKTQDSPLKTTPAKKATAESMSRCEKVPTGTGSPLDKVRDELLLEWTNVQSFQATVKIYWARPCDCDVKSRMEAVGTYEYQRLGESGLVRLEAPFVIKYLGKGTLGANDDKSVDALTQERITFDLVHVFDGISAYWDISSIEAKTTTPPEERTIPSRVVQTVEDKLGNNELYGLYPQHVLRQNPSGWTWELLPDATVDGTALSMIAAQPDKETVVAQKIARYQFSFDKTTGILVESEMFDKDENRVGKVEFANIKVNAVIAAGRFQYTPPAGIKLEPPPVF